MTRIKMCGLSREVDIKAANELKPDYIGFVFWEKSRRYVTDERAGELKKLLDPGIKAVGVFFDDDIKHVIRLAKDGIIDMIQLHGHEDEAYMDEIRKQVNIPIIRAFIIKSQKEVLAVDRSKADYVLLDAGTGSGETINWGLLSDIKREYFLAGGLTPQNVSEAISSLHPYAVDVSSGIETDGFKDPDKMKKFITVVENFPDCGDAHGLA